jgi:hypothetical protein
MVRAAGLTARICRVLGEQLDKSAAFGARLLGQPDADADALALRACGALKFQARRTG